MALVAAEVREGVDEWRGKGGSPEGEREDVGKRKREGGDAEGRRLRGERGG